MVTEDEDELSKDKDIAELHDKELTKDLDDDTASEELKQKPPK